MKLNIPNSLTFLRIVLVLVSIYLHHIEYLVASFTILVFAALSDFFDGYLARKLKQETHFGAIFDPIADKIFALLLYAYLSMQANFSTYHHIYFVAVIFRNFSQLLCLPILVLWLKKTFYVKPKNHPKWATALSSIYSFLFLFPVLMGLFPSMLVSIALTVSLILEIWIVVTYWPRLFAIARGKHDTFE